MSLAKLVFPILNWAELSEIISYLTLRELWQLGGTCRTAFVTFMREKTYREGQRMLERPNLPHARFLSKYSTHDKVLLVSYPRSGNSFVRKMLEMRTGIVTGSDSRPNRTLSASLLKFGYRGEGVVDQSVWIVKSHYPERLGYMRVAVKRVVLVVRNPFDSIESYFHMAMTNTHDKVLTDESFNTLLTLWKDFVANEASVWTAFHQFWLERYEEVPIYIVRYEDLLTNEESCLAKIEEFLREGCPPTGLSRYKSKNSDELFAKPEQGPGYKPKNRKIGKSLAKMSVDSALDVVSKTKPLMDLFGYKLVQTNAEVDSSDLASTQYEVHVSASLIDQMNLINGKKKSVDTLITDKLEIRLPTDLFGRKVTDVRRKYTSDDTNPFPTV